MKIEKMMAAFAILMFALSAAGFVYSAWTDEVYIEGTVHMGELIVGILNNSIVVTETTNGVPEEDFDPSKPWVANAIVTLDEFETSAHHEPRQTVAHKMIIHGILMMMW